jgi:thiol-disulfide isomerase/thioredoxin
MSRLLPTLALLALLGGPSPSAADEPPARRASRVIEGRALDAQGKPAREGKVLFGPQSVATPFFEAAVATIDPEGRFRIELADFPPYGPTPLLAADSLRYLVLAPGFRATVGTIAAGRGPTTVDIRLMAEPWRTTDALLTDREGRPVADAEVTIRAMGGSISWSRLTTDAEGRCRIAMPAGHPFSVSIRREGYLPTALALRNTEDGPTGFRIRLHEPIRGRVIDSRGKPLPGVRIGQGIGPDFSGPGGIKAPGPMVLHPIAGMKQPATTDGEGRFVLTPTVRVSSLMPDQAGEFRDLPQTFSFTDENLRQFAFLGIDFKDPIPEQEVILRPARLVRIPLEHEVEIPSGDLITGWNLRGFLIADKPDVSVMGGLLPARKPGGAPASRIETYFPEGSYRLRVSSNDPKWSQKAVESAEVDLTVPPGEGPLDLPTIRLSAPPDQRLVGQPAPEIEATDLDTGRPVRLADFRGRVLVLDFWGYWCGPCVTTMPAMAEVHRHFEGQPVTILGLHDQSIQSREEYDRKLAGVKQQLWEGRELPFRVALDRPDPDRPEARTPEATGLTCKRYNIKGFPTLLVIDQGGKVAGMVPFHDHDRLERMIRDLLAKGPAR